MKTNKIKYKDREFKLGLGDSKINGIRSDAVELLDDYDLDGISDKDLTKAIRAVADEVVGEDDDRFDGLVDYLFRSVQNRVRGVDSEFYKDYGGY